MAVRLSADVPLVVVSFVIAGVNILRIRKTPTLGPAGCECDERRPERHGDRLSRLSQASPHFNESLDMDTVLQEATGSSRVIRGHHPLGRRGAD